MKKLLIVNGAGASLDFGMPSVRDVDSLFSKWGNEWLPLTTIPNASLYSWVKDTLEGYITNNSNNRKEVLLNFENILFTIQSLAELDKDHTWAQYRNRLSPFIDLKKFPPIRNYLGKEQDANGDDFAVLHSRLVDNLLDHFRKQCQDLSSKKHKEVQQLRSFLTSLKDEFGLGIINLNYDNVVLSALPDLKTGFNAAGEFDRSILYDQSWNFCYHLHGSVHFDMKSTEGQPLHRIFWNKDLHAVFASNSSGRSGNFSGEGIMHLSSNIIAGLDKANQLLREPFANYFMQLDRLIYEADAILFIGYGFADQHLNKAFQFIRYDKTKTRKVGVLDYASDKEDGISWRHDGWSLGIFTTVPFNGFEMAARKFAERHPAVYFKRHNTFEKSYNPEYPLAIWYNGLLPACQFPDKFKKELL